MYAPKAFREQRPGPLLDFIEQWSFGLLVGTGADARLQATHVPFLVERGSGGQPVLVTHVAAANPQAAVPAEGVPVLAVFTGPHAYVSPRWMTTPAREVPTWNYVAVHARGTAFPVMRDETVERALTMLTRKHEGDTGWRLEHLDEDRWVGLRRALTVIRIEIDDLEGAWKLSQNKSLATQRSIAKALAANEDAGARAIAGLMRVRDQRLRRGASLRDVYARVLALLRAWWDRRRWRAELAMLDARARRDIGVHWEDVQRECGKPFWRG